jgi:hypothetical protein
MEKNKQGSILGAAVWMFAISLLLFWLPVIGPLLAGIVGGKKAGGLASAIIAVFLPAIILGVGLFLLASISSGLPIIGFTAGLGGFSLALINVGPMLLGAIIGGVLSD